MAEGYDEKDIQVLKGTEGIRKRPAMYIGDTGSRGFHHLVFEVMDNSIDEAMANRCTKAIVTLNQDNSITILDNGAGIPADIHPEHKTSTLELILTNLHSGGKFGKKAYAVSGGLHGIGLSAVCALSETFKVESYRGDAIYIQEYEKGQPVSDVEVFHKPEGQSSGTLIRFRPDASIFQTISTFSFDLLAARFRELAYLTEGFTIIFYDKRDLDDNEQEKVETYYFEGGLIQYIEDLSKNRKKLDVEEILYIKNSLNDVEVEIALTYTNSYQEVLRSFVNNIHTREGGTHVSGFKTALTRTLNEFARRMKLLKENDENLKGDDTREGIIAIISVKVPVPQFEGQTKTKLGNGEVEGIVQSIFGKNLKESLEEKSAFGKAIVQKAIMSRRARLAAQQARELIRKNASSRVSLPGKLISSREKDPTKRELFLVEGQSAGGTAVKARDSGYQEVLFLRGKVLNVEKARLNRSLENQEIRNIITAIGTGIHDDVEMEKLRYGKVIILTDADVDGQHIATLLLTLFFRYMYPLVENGNLYVARPPLYKISFSKATKNKKEQYVYLYNDKDRDVLISGLRDMQMSEKDIAINRFKGLGEMNADQLEETVMANSTRRLDRINVADLDECERWITTLMGDNILGRKEFINGEVFFEEDTLDKGDFYSLAFSKEEEEELLDAQSIIEEEGMEKSTNEDDFVDLLESWSESPEF